MLLPEVIRTTAQAHAEAVDRDARFPIEAITALKDARLLSALLDGQSLTEVVALCGELGRCCAATGMVYAMHQSQVACLVRHGLGHTAWDAFADELREKQLLIASITSEVGVGGDIRTSLCAIDNGRITKKATTLSYGAHADAYFLTCRRQPDAPENDQALVLLRREEADLEQTGNWDTLGMRGTCSPGFTVSSPVAESALFPVGFGEICSQTMAPASHLLWAGVWLGIAADAVTRARAYVRSRAKNAPGAASTGELRLAEAMSQLQLGRANLAECLRSYEALCAASDTRGLLSFEWAIRINNLKTSTSELIVSIIQQCLAITGIQGYRNDSPYSLGRHLRDALSAAVMIGNERLHAVSGSLLLMQKGI